MFGEEDGAAELLAALITSPHLQSLDVRGNRIADTTTLADTKRANVAFQRLPLARREPVCNA